MDENAKRGSLRILGCFGVIAVFVLIVMIWAAIGDSRWRAEQAAIESARSPMENEAIRAAISSVTSGVNMGEFQTGIIQGGVGIISSFDAAYWYKNGTVYYANGVAMAHSVNIPRAPIGIGYSEIEDAIRRKESGQDPLPTKLPERPSFMDEVKFGLTFEQRLQLSRELSAATARAQDEAEQIAPIDDVGIERWAEVNSELTEEYELEVYEKFGVRKSDVFPMIVTEGMEYRVWKSHQN